MKVLIAIDDSPYSKHVVQQVMRRRWPKDTEFKLVTVLEEISEPLEVLEEFNFTRTMQEIQHKREDRARQLCSKVKERLSAVPLTTTHFEVRKGKAVNEILKAATDWNANKILIGAHGRGLCPHGFLGSVSRAVTERAHCTVEVVREGSGSTQDSGDTVDATESAAKSVANAV
jgi:nucleotide-binding universal stress UspA family protein